MARLRPDVEDPAGAITAGAVMVDGRIVSNPAALVRADAAVRVIRRRRLRGEIKLSHALRELGVDASGRVAMDVGAAAGGFTSALLAAGAVRVYAVDTGHGQLRGWLRADPRVVNLEGRNLGQLDRNAVSEVVQVVTVDLSYLSLAGAIPELDRVGLAEEADLVVLVKPTFELRRATLATTPEDLAEGERQAGLAMERCGWAVVGRSASPITGSRGAVEVFLHGRRQGAGAGSAGAGGAPSR